MQQHAYIYYMRVVARMHQGANLSNYLIMIYIWLFGFFVLPLTRDEEIKSPSS